MRTTDASSRLVPKFHVRKTCCWRRLPRRPDLLARGKLANEAALAAAAAAAAAAARVTASRESCAQEEFLNFARSQRVRLPVRTAGRPQDQLHDELKRSRPFRVYRFEFGLPASRRRPAHLPSVLQAARDERAAPEQCESYSELLILRALGSRLPGQRAAEPHSRSLPSTENTIGGPAEGDA